MVPVSFRTLFDAEAPAVLARLQRLGVPARDRADVAQLVFLEVARHLHELDPSRPARPWLAAITCNKARDYFKGARVRFELVGVEADDMPAQEDRVVDRLAAAALVRRLFRSLSYDDREVLTLVDLEERTVPEVADILGLSAKAVEMRLARARERFAAAHERVRAGERRRLGEAAALFMLTIEELVRAAREADEDLGAEVQELRARLERVLRPALPRGQAPAPLAAWCGLVVVTAIAVVGAVDGLSHPRPVIGPECPPAAIVVAPTATPAPSVEAVPELAAVPVAPLPSARPASWSPRVATRPALASSATPAVAPATSAAATTTPAPAELSEVELLSLARRAMHEGSPQRARVFLLRHGRAYPNGSLAPEREVLLRRVQAP